MFEWYPLRIRQTALDNLKSYKYSSIDKSPVSKYIMQPYWTWATTLFPMWMAPNLITLLGFILVTGNVILVMCTVPDLTTGGPSWIYFSMAAAIWLYSTFDNVDGKQARRTNSSSPLGELFDHGVDALNCTFGGILQAAGICTGLGLRLPAIIFITTAAFFFSTWETYYTGTLYLGYINGPTEGLILAVASLIVSGIYGPGFWLQPLSAMIPAVSVHLPPELLSIRLSDVCILGIFVMLVFTQIPVSIYRAASACRTKRLSVIAALLNIVPYILINLVVLAWITAPESTVSPDNALVFVCAWGVAFGRIAALIVLAHVTHTEYPTYWFLSVPFCVGAFIARAPRLFKINAIFTPATESVYITVMFVVMSIEYVVWALCVIEQFCRHLGIRCLRIPYRRVEGSAVAVSTPRGGGKAGTVARSESTTGKKRRDATATASNGSPGVAEESDHGAVDTDTVTHRKRKHKGTDIDDTDRHVDTDDDTNHVSITKTKIRQEPAQMPVSPRSQQRQANPPLTPRRSTRLQSRLKSK